MTRISVFLFIIISWICLICGREPYLGHWEDMSEKYDLRHYQPYTKIVQELRRLSDEVEGNTLLKKTLFSIGTTFEDRDILALKISESEQTSNNKKKEKKKTIVIECGAHAREWISISTCMYLVNKFSSGCCGKLLSKFDWVFIPVLNPDGYVYTWKNNETRMWRKNRSYTIDQLKVFGKTGKELCIGVDINRNFNISWGKVAAPTKNPCYEMYAGSHPFSEKESQSLANYLNQTKHDVIAYVSLHNYGQAWMTPYGFTKRKPRLYKEMARVAKLAVKSMKAYSNVVYRVGNSHDALYPNSGNSVDWAYRNLGIPYTYLVEMVPHAGIPKKLAFLSEPSLMVKNCKEIFIGIKSMAMNLKT